MEIKRAYLEVGGSSNVEEVSYGFEEKTFSVKFKGGRLYHYLDVDFNLFVEFVKSDSAGKFINDNLKGIFKCVPAVGPKHDT